MSDVESMSLEEAEQFPLLFKNLLTHDVDLISCCPTADLILLLTSGNELKLYRKGQTLLWTIGDDDLYSRVKAIAWHPNGREVVAGCEDGSLYHIDVRYGSPRITKCQLPDTVSGALPSSVTSLKWIRYVYKETETYIEGFDNDTFDIESKLPLLIEESPEPPKTRMIQLGRRKSILPLKPDTDRDSQSLLLVGHSNGQLHFLLNGKYSIAHCNVADDTIESIHDICVKDDASIVQVLATAKSDQHKIPQIHKVDTRYLKKRKQEISNIAGIQLQVDYLLKYITACVDDLKKHHDHYTYLTRKLVRQTSDCVLRSNENAIAMPAIEFIGPLATGMVTEPVNQLFHEVLNLTGIKQTEEDTDYGHKHSIEAVSQYILPACDRLLLQLSKLLGYSLWKQRYGDLLNENEIDKCIQLAREFIFLLYEFKDSLQTLMKGFKAFITWLSAVWQKVATSSSESGKMEDCVCEEPELVLQYLQTSFEDDPLLIYFGRPSDASIPDKNISRLASLLVERCRGVLCKPSIAISSNTEHMFTLSLTGFPTLSSVCRLTSHTSHDNTIYYAISESLPYSKVTLLKNRIKDDTVEYTSFRIEGELTDAELFDEAEVGVVTQIDKETTYLQTYLLANLKFEAYQQRITTSTAQPSRVQTLTKMIKVRMGCNGLKRRRLVCLVPFNRMLQIRSMDAEDEDDD